MSLLTKLRFAFQAAPPVHPLDRRMAKWWVKERLKRLYPELRANPRALEEAYQALSLDPLVGRGEDGETLFEISLPDRIE